MEHSPSPLNSNEEFDVFAAIASEASHYDDNPPDQETLDMWAKYATLDEIQKAKEEARRVRISDCGKWSYRFDPHTGQRTNYQFKCNLFRECAFCRGKRAELEYEFVKQASSIKSLRYVVTSELNVVNIIRRNDGKRNNYVRFPQKDGNEILIYDESFTSPMPSHIAENDATFEWVTGLNWDNVVNTPEGRNISGGVHRPKSDAPAEKFSIIQTQNFVTSASFPEVRKIMDKAIAMTQHLAPKTAEEVEDAIRIRTSKAKTLLEESGHQVRMYFKKEKLVLSKISWLIKDINTENQYVLDGFKANGAMKLMPNVGLA